jgi:hypothetical protein
VKRKFLLHLDAFLLCVPSTTPLRPLIAVHPLHPSTRPPSCLHTLSIGVRALTTPYVPPRRHACPSHPHVRPACSRAHPVPTNVRASYFIVRALMAGGRTRYIRGRGPSYPHFITLGFVSQDSFVGSLHEAVGMV